MASSTTTLCTHVNDAPLQSRAAESMLISHTSPEWVQKPQLSGYVLRYLRNGAEKFRTQDNIFTLEAGQFLILNPGTQLQYSPLSEKQDGIWIWLEPRMVYQQFTNWSTQYAGNWQTLVTDQKGAPQWCEHTYAAEHTPLGQFLNTNDHQLDGEILLEKLFSTQRMVFEQMAQLTSAKLSTKMELFRRLCQARNYIHHNLDAALDLDTLAQVACLSKFHFIRLFKEAFGQTPRQYLIAHRLEHARSLLLNSSKTFHEICQEVGLKDSSSFGRLFKRN